MIILNLEKYIQLYCKSNGFYFRQNKYKYKNVLLNLKTYYHAALLLHVPFWHVIH